jgi:hypothetical protein
MPPSCAVSPRYSFSSSPTCRPPGDDDLHAAGAAYPAVAGSTTAQIANAAGVAAIGAVFFAVESGQSARLALLAASALFALSIITAAAFLTSMRHATVTN